MTTYQILLGSFNKLACSVNGWQGSHTSHLGPWHQSMEAGHPSVDVSIHSHTLPLLCLWPVS